jgi:fido (protein-threonine AMPylation protein)
MTNSINSGINSSENQLRLRLPSYRLLKKLRITLAIARGTVFWPILQQELEGTVSQDQTKRVSYLTELFSRIHREIFVDWKEQVTVNHRPGSIIDPNKRKAFRETIARLVLDGETNQASAIFDHNGFAISVDNLAERLASFYHQMRHVRPFAYGNRLTLDYFMTVLAKLPAIKSVYEQGIDFRRIDAQDAMALHQSDSRYEDIVRAFQHAMDPGLSKSLKNPANGYGKWPEHKKFVSGIPFLSHVSQEGVECLVAVNGGLVPLEHIKQELFLAGKHLADYPLCAAENMIGYLPGTGVLRTLGQHEIDGIVINENGAAPLFCLDINLLSGLRSPSHTELMELIKQCAGEKGSVLDLAGNEALKRKLLIAANDDARLARTIEIAYERLGKMMVKLDAARDEVFAGKSSVANPQLFMSMGGAGAGKTAVEEIARAQCGENFVIASLDEFRKKSDLYQVLIAAGHHSDDYVYIEPFANRLRDAVADYALKNRFNLLYDGTGIPYYPRYAKIIESFKSAGFQTQVTAVDAFLVKPAGRESELSRSGVIGSVKNRFELTRRALPWVVTIDKHIRAPRSFFQALEHLALDKISLIANDGERDQHYLVAESFDFGAEELRILQQHQLSASLADYLKNLIFQRDDSFLKKLAQGKEPVLARLINRNVAFIEGNVAYQAYPNARAYRVLLIYHLRRLIDFVEKRQLNPNASSEAGLLHKPETLAFHVDPLTKFPWLTRLQDSLD